MRTYLLITALLAAPAIAAAPMSGAQYVAKAGASDQYELQSSRLMLASSKNAGLRSYAQDMIKDHTTSTAEVKAAAMQGKVKAGPPKLDATGVRNMAALRAAAAGPARDKLYVQQQKLSHRQALALQQGYAADGTVAPLKATAAKIVPVVQHHLAMIEKM